MTAVDSSYAGPRLDGDISAGFMDDLLTWMRDQKILHRKYAFKVGMTSGIGAVKGIAVYKIL